MCWCIQVGLQLAEAAIGPSAAGHDWHLEWYQEKGGHLNRGTTSANLALKRASKFLVGSATGKKESIVRTEIHVGVMRDGVGGGWGGGRKGEIRGGGGMGRARGRGEKREEGGRERKPNHGGMMHIC